MSTGWKTTITLAAAAAALGVWRLVRHHRSDTSSPF